MSGVPRSGRIVFYWIFKNREYLLSTLGTNIRNSLNTRIGKPPTASTFFRPLKRCELIVNVFWNFDQIQSVNRDTLSTYFREFIGRECLFLQNTTIRCHSVEEKQPNNIL